MKKTLLMLCLIVISYDLFAQNGQLINGGFENWTTQTYDENPDLWMTANTQTPVYLPTTSKSLDAQHMNYSARLDVVTYNGDTLAGIITLMNTNQFGGLSGVPYSDNCNQLTGYYKSSLSAGDTAYAIVLKYSNGSIVGYSELVISTLSQSSWTAFNYPISPAAQDSIVISFSLGKPSSGGKAIPGDYFMIDNIGLSNNGTPASALPNYSFENWTTITDEIPDTWLSSDYYSIRYGINSCTKTTDAFSGNFALRLENHPYGVTPYYSYLTNAIPDTVNGGYNYVPYAATPTTFSGAYKYSAVALDSGFIYIGFFQNTNLIGGYSAYVSNTSNAYVPFSYTLNITGVPDSMYLYFSTGMQIGSVLQVDDLSLSGGNVSVSEIESATQFHIWPNPAESILNLELQLPNKTTTSVSIIDISGKVVMNHSFENTSTEKQNRQIDCSGLTRGLYLVRVEQENFSLVRKLIIN